MWTLVLFAYAGIFADGDSMALTHIKGFSSEQVCIAAGNKTKDLVKNTKKEIRFVCVKDS